MKTFYGILTVWEEIVCGEGLEPLREMIKTSAPSAVRAEEIMRAACRSELGVYVEGTWDGTPWSLDRVRLPIHMKTAFEGCSLHDPLKEERETWEKNT